MKLFLMMSVNTILVLTLFVVFQQQQLFVQANPPAIQSTYLIRGKLVKDLTAAVTKLRQFLPVKQAKFERCQRLAILLQTINEKNVNNFQISPIALIRTDLIRSKYNAIDVEGLRNFYINAINNYLQTQVVDDGLIEIIDCLSDKFRSTDAKARSFLNDAQLKTIVEQYKIVSTQPLTMLTDSENFKMPNELKYENLNPLIKKYLLELFDNDEAKVEELFKDKVKEEEEKKESDANEGANVHENTNEEAKPEVSEVSKEAASSVAEERVGETEPQQAAKEEKEEEEEEEVTSKEGGELDEESRKYLEQLFETISKVYNTLPLSAKIGDRCQAYGFVIDAEHEHLGEELFVKALVDQAEEHINKVGANDQVSLPNDNARENFLFAASYAQQFMQDSDPDAMFDLQECVEHLTAAEQKPVAQPADELASPTIKQK